jgi:hypothetical protein
MRFAARIVVCLMAMCVALLLACSRDGVTDHEVDFGVQVCDLGVVRPGGIASTRIVCRNTSANHLIGVPLVSSSCGCSKASLVEENIAPNSDFEIMVQLDPEGRSGGQKERIHMLWPGLARLTLVVEATVAPELEMFPSYGISALVTRGPKESLVNASCKLYFSLAKPVTKVDTPSMRVSGGDGQFAAEARLVKDATGDHVRLEFTGEMPKSIDEVSGYVLLRYAMNDVWREVNVPLMVVRSSPLWLSLGAVGPIAIDQQVVRLKVICGSSDVVSGLQVVAAGESEQVGVPRIAADTYEISVSALRRIGCRGLWVSSADGCLYEVPVLW